jgi:hypothetical protein
MTTTNDRVEIAYDFTVNLGNFENVKIHIGYASDVQHGETVEEAYDRVDAFVTEKVTKEVVEARKGAK